MVHSKDKTFLCSNFFSLTMKHSSSSFGWPFVLMDGRGIFTFTGASTPRELFGPSKVASNSESTSRSLKITSKTDTAITYHGQNLTVTQWNYPQDGLTRREYILCNNLWEPLASDIWFLFQVLMYLLGQQRKHNCNRLDRDRLDMDDHPHGSSMNDAFHA